MSIMWGTDCSGSMSEWSHVTPIGFAIWICLTFRPRGTGRWCSYLWILRLRCSGKFLAPMILLEGIGLSAAVGGLSMRHSECSGLFYCCLCPTMPCLGTGCLSFYQNISEDNGSFELGLLSEHIWYPSNNWSWRCDRLGLSFILIIQVRLSWFWMDNFIDWTWLTILIWLT